MPQPALILASASPRRRELLKLICNRFEVVSAAVNERSDAQSLKQSVVDIAKLKAKAVVAMGHEGVVVGADTAIAFEHELIGKPQDAEHAEQILRQLSATTHEVLTGMVVIDTLQDKTITDCVCTKVWFKNLTDAQIAWYVATGESAGKAGAYAIQGQGALLVDHIEGDFYNVMGLPIARLADMLSDIGYLTYTKS